MRGLASLIGSCFCGAVLAACGTGIPSSVPTSVSPQAGVLRAVAGQTSGASKNGDLYVANATANTVTVYVPGSDSVLRTISQGVNGPDALAFDGAGDLYVANAGANTVTVYAAGTSSVLRTIDRGVNDPEALAFDDTGDLYVANAGANTVTIYAPGTSSVLRTISNGINVPDALAFSKAGDLQVGNVFGGGYSAGTVTSYAPGREKPRRTLPQGSAPVALALDGSGNLYVANDSPPCCYENWVTVYSPSEKLLRTINLVHHPDALAFDGSGNLYVADNGGKYGHPVGQVTVFAPGSESVLRTISIGVSHPVALATDPFNDLFVANANTVTVYTNGETLQRTISQGIGGPRALAFGP
jgi:sugar lactone lactonase YvrE